MKNLIIIFAGLLLMVSMIGCAQEELTLEQAEARAVAAREASKASAAARQQEHLQSLIDDDAYLGDYMGRHEVGQSPLEQMSNIYYDAYGSRSQADTRCRHFGVGIAGIGLTPEKRACIVAYPRTIDGDNLSRIEVIRQAAYYKLNPLTREERDALREEWDRVYIEPYYHRVGD